jgi:hypothetical protein
MLEDVQFPVKLNGIGSLRCGGVNRICPLAELPRNGFVKLAAEAAKSA